MTDTENQTYTFAELSDKAMQHARDNYTGPGYLDYDWWDSVYEDAVNIAKILGIDLCKTRKTRSGKLTSEPDIQFSGFSSQGDGACFQGNYSYNPKAVDEINAYCIDGELIRIATELNALQLVRRLAGQPFFTATIGTGRTGYSHSNTMRVDVNCEDEDDEHVEVGDDLEETVQQLMRDFADWIYKTLEETHDWLHSDECVDEALVDETFDEDGNTV